MKIKVCFEGEIHKLSNAPETLGQLRELINSIFQSELPQSYVLKYVDSDGDNIVMTDEKDYEEFRISEPDPAKITKVHVVPVQGNKKDDEVVIVENDQKGEDEEEEDEYQLIQKEDKEDMLPEDVEIHENKEEVLIEKPIEDPKSSSILDINKNESSEILAKEEKTIHSGIKCNGCEMMPIVGIRYKCLTCLGFNYCEECEKNSQHTHHNFIKMKQEDVWDALFPPLSVSIQKKKVPHKPKAFNNVENLYSGQMKEKSAPEEKMPDRNEAAYYDGLMEKVRKMLKCFPKAKADILCAYVNECPEDMTLEELIENYKH